MSNTQQPNSTESYNNPFTIVSEANALMNAVMSQDIASIQDEGEPANLWENFISMVKSKKSDHEKLKETYKDVKKMADSYINEHLEEQSYVKKFII